MMKVLSSRMPVCLQVAQEPALPDPPPLAFLNSFLDAHYTLSLEQLVAGF